MDVVGAALGIVILFPALLVVALWIKCASRGPIFFQQQRIGVGGRPFRMWKFRTIDSHNAAAVHRAYVNQLMVSNGPLAKIDRQLKFIPGGRLLRRLGVDELPQLWNVLRGDMSLVGPRPDVAPASAYEPWQRQRFDVLPGITGLWQVSGKNSTTFDAMMRLDVEYANRRSFWLDAIILLRTAPAVLRG